MFLEITPSAVTRLALYPETLELWRRLARNKVFRDERGSDAPGFLRELIERHQNDRRLTRNQFYQLFLFQATLGMAKARVHHEDPDQHYLHLPPTPDTAEMIAAVRRLKGARYSMTGFRPPEVTRDRWVVLDKPQIIHEPDLRKVLILAKRALSLEASPPDDGALKDALEWVIRPHPPVEIAHPAPPAAAVASIARAPDCQGLWDRVFAFIGRRKPNEGRKPYADLSACMLDCITLANRSNNPHRTATALYYRAQVLVDLWLEQPDQFRMALPRAPKLRPLDRLWTDLEVNFTPRIIFDDDLALALLPKPDGPEGEENGGAASTRKKPNSDAARKRLKTGLNAGDWFLEHYQSVCEDFQGLRLLDCRHHQSGFDFKFKLERGFWYIETKATADSIGSISLSNRQWERARLEGDKYFLVTIRGIGRDRPDALVVRNPAAYLKPRRHVILAPRVERHFDMAELEMVAERGMQ